MKRLLDKYKGAENLQAEITVVKLFAEQQKLADAELKEIMSYIAQGNKISDIQHSFMMGIML